MPRIAIDYDEVYYDFDGTGWPLWDDPPPGSSIQVAYDVLSRRTLRIAEMLELVVELLGKEESNGEIPKQHSEGG